MTTQHVRVKVPNAIIIVMLSVLLVACGQPSTGVRGQVVIAWHSLTGTKEQVLLDLVDEWNRTNPDGITVIPEHRDENQLHDSVIAGIERQALPSLVLASPMQTAVYQQRGILVPMDDFIADPSGAVGWSSADRTDLYPVVLKAGRTATGKTVGIPFGGNLRVMLFNRDWLKTLNLDEAPASWEQFSAVCNKAADRVKGTVCFGLNPNNYVFEQWIAAFGGQVTTDDMNVLQVSTPMAITAMNRLAEFIRTNQAYRVATLVQSREDFASARTLFTFDWSDGLLDVGTTIKQRADFDWGLALLPGAGQKVSTKYSAPLWVITRVPGRLDSSREKASWLFIRWLTQTVQTAHWASLTNELPARLSAINALGSRQPLSANQLTLLRDIVPLARPDPLVSGWRCLEATLSAGITQIMDGQPVTTTLQMTQALGQPQLTQDCVD